MIGGDLMIAKGTVSRFKINKNSIWIYVREYQNFRFHILAPKNWNGKIGDVIEYEHFSSPPNSGRLISQPIKLWIIVHKHRHGEDFYPLWQSDYPDLDEFAKTLDDFEPNREDEWLELSGPFDIPSF